MEPMKEEDILTMSHLYWIEHKGQQELQPVLLRDGDIKFNRETWCIEPDCYPFDRVKPMVLTRFPGNSYGTKWRMWRFKPTPEQRAAAQWE